MRCSGDITRDQSIDHKIMRSPKCESACHYGACGSARIVVDLVLRHLADKLSCPTTPSAWPQPCGRDSSPSRWSNHHRHKKAKKSYLSMSIGNWDARHDCRFLVQSYNELGHWSKHGRCARISPTHLSFADDLVLQLIGSRPFEQHRFSASASPRVCALFGDGHSTVVCALCVTRATILNSSR